MKWILVFMISTHMFEASPTETQKPTVTVIGYYNAYGHCIEQRNQLNADHKMKDYICLEGLPERVIK